VPPSRDPGYVLPGGTAPVILALVTVLTVLALWVSPWHPARRRPGTAAVPRPAVVGACCALGALGLLYPFAGVRHPAFTHGAWVPLPMFAAAGTAMAAGLGLRRWGAAGIRQKGAAG
jgi:hypothetical protein